MEEEAEEESEETEETLPSNTKQSSWWKWIVIAVAGCVVVGAAIALIVCLAKRHNRAKSKKPEKILELQSTKLQKSNLLFSQNSYAH